MKQLMNVSQSSNDVRKQKGVAKDAPTYGSPCRYVRARSALTACTAPSRYNKHTLDTIMLLVETQCACNWTDSTREANKPRKPANNE